MRRPLLFASVATGLFLALAAMETLKSDGPFSFAALAQDLFETALLALAVVATAYVALEARELKRERSDLLNDIARAKADGERWRAAARAHVDGLTQAISAQFQLWSLGPAEAEIAMLMLKGFSHKEIARLRNTSAATIRQQAAAVYRKSGLNSRAELAAFFLEDLFAPPGAEASASEHSLKLVK